MFPSGKIFPRILCMVLSLFCVLALVQPAAAVMEQIPGTKPFTYTSDVYYRPYTQSLLIGKLEHGTELEVLSETEDFYRIDCSGMSGYISKAQVSCDKNGVYTVSCTFGSEDTSMLEYTPLLEALQQRKSLLNLAKDQLGIPYVYGGISRYGFDCSGFTYYVYGKHDMPLNRCADTQMENGIIVDREDLQPGDLVFFRYAGAPWLASHVGIYVGDNQMIHAGSRGISYADLDMPYWANSYVGARRIIAMDASPVEPTAPTEAADVHTVTRSTH